MKVFSKTKCIARMISKDSDPFTTMEEILLVHKWINECDGQPVINGRIEGLDGIIYESDPHWEVELGWLI